MNFHVLTLFPDMIRDGFETSITGKAVEKGLLTLETVNIRDFSVNKHNRVDDYPYGGGAGMVMQAEPVCLAYESVASRLPKKPKVLYMSPQGRRFDQAMAQELAEEEELVLLCGHYEGIDERVLEEIVDEEVSIGDYVLTGGELAALVIMDAVSRMVGGVLHNEESAQFDSFHDNLLEYPQYSRPEVWRGKAVPPILLSGHHANVEKWRREQSLLRTRMRRPDLLEGAALTKQDRRFLRELDQSLSGKDEET
ncbi:MAG: tRNA (guanosine(37)-N1)-methyltransferase TrmD [Eubacteriales bacterium]|nr:tRNA (guanosine(37)-N1)-methyltransferase TrmD [Eubacteriales bacterium]